MLQAMCPDRKLGHFRQGAGGCQTMRRSRKHHNILQTPGLGAQLEAEKLAGS